MTKIQRILCDDLDILDEYTKPDYIELDNPRIERISKPGSYDGAALIDGEWVAKSLLRCDPEGNLWVRDWKYEQIKY